MRLSGKVAIVTGAARGIGRAIAERFKAEGAQLMLADVNGEGLAQTAKELETRAERIDVGYKVEVDRLMARTLDAYGRLDIMVANAGISKAQDFLDLGEDDFDTIIRTNLKSAFLCGQAAARQMVAQNTGGVIINMSSINAVVAIPTQVPYAASKGGISALTRAMSISLAAKGIRVVAIGPGTILTELSKSAVLTDAAARRTLLSRTPMGRFGDTSEVASIAAFLASDDASYITGQTIYPDGGRLALNYTVPVMDDA